MKKTILTVSLLVLMTGFTTCFSQEAQTNHKKEHRADLSPEEIAKRKTDHMTKALDLDKDQQASIYDVNLKHEKKQAILKVEKRELKAKYQTEKKAYKADLDDVLSEEQKMKLAELKTKQVEKRSKIKPPHPPKPIQPIE